MIILENLGKAYRARNGGYTWLFRNVSVVFPSNASVGILATPGSGKTTLIDLMAGIDTPSEGRIQRRGKVSWPFGSKINLTNKHTAKQNLRFLTDIYDADYESACRFVADFSELGRYMDLPLRQCTSEMRNRFAISALLAMDFDHFLIDSTMEGGDGKFRQKCRDFIGKRLGTISFFMATDDEQLVSNFCQIGGVLHDGSLTFYNSVPEAQSVFRRLQRNSPRIRA